MLRSVFVNAGHVRSGWRFASFAIVVALLLIAAQRALSYIPATAPLIEHAKAGALSVNALLLLDGMGLAVVLAVTAVAARLERRSFAAFGLPRRSAFGARFWEGLLWGLAMATLDLGATWLLGGVSFEPPSASIAQVVGYGVAWALGFVLVGLFEELLYRGYALTALSRGIGFWPAAIVLGAMFGGIHLLNEHETFIGALNVVAYALFASFTLRRSGNLWFAIGIHAGWDYSQSFLYAVPNSGMSAQDHLFQANMHGPTWLTGGAVGPEGSLIGFVVLALAFVVFSRRFPYVTDKRESLLPTTPGSASQSKLG